jgi:hypothetical protein
MQQCSPPPPSPPPPPPALIDSQNGIFAPPQTQFSGPCAAAWTASGAIGPVPQGITANAGEVYRMSCNGFDLANMQYVLPSNSIWRTYYQYVGTYNGKPACFNQYGKQCTANTPDCPCTGSYSSPTLWGSNNVVGTCTVCPVYSNVPKCSPCSNTDNAGKAMPAAAGVTPLASRYFSTCSIQMNQARVTSVARPAACVPRAHPALG